MNRSQKQASRSQRAKTAANLIGDRDNPLSVLLRMMNDPTLNDRRRAAIAKICLPYVHPRIEPVGLPEAPKEAKLEDLSDPKYQFELARLLAFALSHSIYSGKSLSNEVQEAIKGVVATAATPPVAQPKK